MSPIDFETGEILKQNIIYTKADEIAIVVNPSKSSGRAQRFLKLKISQKAKRRLKKLSVHEAGFLLKIAPYACYQTNILAHDGESGIKGSPINTSDIIKITGLSKPTALKILHSLIEKNVIGFMVSEGIRKAMIINPDYLQNGGSVHKSVLEAFRSREPVDNI